MRRRLIVSNTQSLLQAKTYAAAKDWDSLLAMASERKSPVGIDLYIALGKESGAPDNIMARFSTFSKVNKLLAY